MSRAIEMPPVGNVAAAARLFDKTGYRRSRGERWRDFVTMCYTSVAKLATMGDDADKLEAEYMAAVKHYSPEEVAVFPALLAWVRMGLVAGGDPMGSLAGAVETLNEGAGQFFTPWEICRLNAAMIMGDAGDIIRKRGYIKIAEPAVGGGAMVLAAADILRGQGHDPATTMWVDATDVDTYAYRMAYTQLSLAGVPGVVRHGNALTTEQWGMRYTLATGAFVEKHGGTPRMLENKPKAPRKRVRGERTWGA